MTAIGAFSARGFQVTASSALDLLAGTQAASAGMVSANVREMAGTLHVDLGNISRTITAQGRQLASVNAQGFQSLQRALAGGFGSLEMLSGVSIAVQAVGFAAVAAQLQGVRRDLRELSGMAAELVDLQRHANAHMETLVNFAERQFKTQEQILATLVHSRTVEAQQLIRQGWDNLRNGYEDEAFERFGRSLDHDNTVYVAHAELGMLHEKRGGLDKAEDHLRRASRFALQGGPPLAAFAMVQLAAFLDRRGRVADARAELREGLKAWCRAPWVFYLAELEATAGEPGQALAILRDAVHEDVTLFDAAMMSERLQTLQPGLTQTLIEIDQSARAPTFAALQRACVAIRQLRVFEVDAETHRKRAAELFVRASSARFADLGALCADVDQAAADVERDVDLAARAASVPVAYATETCSRYLVRPPDTSIPGTPTASLMQFGAILALVAGGFVSCASYVVASDASSHSVLVSAALFLVPAVLLYAGAGLRRKSERAIEVRKATDRWWWWLDRAEFLVRDVQQHRDDFRRRVGAAAQIGPRQTLSDGLQWLDGLALPKVPQAPTWVEMRAAQPMVACLHCGSEILAAAVYCEHCKRNL